MAQTLSDVMSAHGLAVRLPPTRRCMHFPANGHHLSVIDLVFLPSDDSTATVKIGNHGESDHAPIFTNISLLHLEAHTKPSIKLDSDEESDFLEMISSAIKHISLDGLFHTNKDIDTVMGAMSSAFMAAWDKHSSDPSPVCRLKSW